MKRASFAAMLMLMTLGLTDAQKTIADDDCVERRDPRNATERVCEEAKVVEIYDPETQLEVVEYKSDLDWKVTKPKLPWSKIVKLKSDLDGGYDLMVFDGDYSDNFSTGAKEGVVTRWSIDSVKELHIPQEGALWTCTYERSVVNQLAFYRVIHRK